MPSHNAVTILGHLVRDPVIRSTPQGQQLTEFDIATNYRWTGPNGATQEDTCYLSVTVWGKQAPPVAQYGRKGRLALVVGRLRQDRWQDDDGQMHSKHFVQASRVIWCDPPPKQANHSQAQQEDTTHHGQ